MPKIKSQCQPFIDDLTSVLSVPGTAFIEFYNEDDLDAITDSWMALERYNLETEGTEPDDDLDFPNAAIFASLNKSDHVNCFYVTIYGMNSCYLYTLESLSKAIDLIRTLRVRYIDALKDAESTAGSIRTL